MEISQLIWIIELFECESIWSLINLINLAWERLPGTPLCRSVAKFAGQLRSMPIRTWRGTLCLRKKDPKHSHSWASSSFLLATYALANDPSLQVQEEHTIQLKWTVLGCVAMVLMEDDTTNRTLAMNPACWPWRSSKQSFTRWGHPWLFPGEALLDHMWAPSQAACKCIRSGNWANILHISSKQVDDDGQLSRNRIWAGWTYANSPPALISVPNSWVKFALAKVQRSLAFQTNIVRALVRAWRVHQAMSNLEQLQ